MEYLTILLHDDLEGLLYRRLGREKTVLYPLSRCAAIKDVLESLGIPHPEIGSILINGREGSFSEAARAGQRLEVFGLRPPVDVLTATCLRPALQAVHFAVDVNVGKLATLLRMAGLDTFYDSGLDDAGLAARATADGRILLTRDRVLLMHKIVAHGHLISQCRPKEQLAEVIRLYDLRKSLAPFSRCLVCNGVLESVDKQAVIHRLLPLTRQYYQSFKLCRTCDKVYWAGSHRERMAQCLAGLEV